jgi:hypothetical protein
LNALQTALRETLEQITLEDLRRDENAMGSWLDPVALDMDALTREESA